MVSAKTIQKSKLGGNLKELNIVQAELADDVHLIKAHYDTHKEWKQDKVGYWLIRIDRSKKQIQAGFCKKDNLIETIVTGNDAEDIYNTILREKLVKSMQHAAYLGYELMKAEVALKSSLEFVQDKPLNFDTD
jgi:dihydropteroate synthase